MAVVTDPAARLLGGITQAIAVVIALAVIAGGILFTGLRTSASLMLTVNIVPPRDRTPRLGIDSEVETFYRTVTIIDEHASGWVRLLAWLPNASMGLLILAGCVFVFVQTRRMLRGRMFSRSTTASLAILGVLAILVAVVAPMVDAQATVIALRDLGANSLDARAGLYDAPDLGGIDVVVPDPAWSPRLLLARSNWLLAGVGGILLLAVAAGRGERLQRDTDGLV
ncbi:hypothetical protein [Microbacterium oleivorans]|uniref:Uncharacterized protein n=1 Tax=Microbacterium oleivorans TaxID=273677 RepID=A0A7D5IZM0_9MICO|nr:hypothetical protein [Microbacterium oleivorans]QLD12075.1 hypothetical protein HW566_10055 [Microbacterium oleivorans]